MCKEENYVIKKIVTNRLEATSIEDTKEKYYRLGLDEHKAGDTEESFEIYPERLEIGQSSAYKDVDETFIRNLYDDNSRLNLEVQELRERLTWIEFLSKGLLHRGLIEKVTKNPKTTDQ